ncbi:MAG: hypothetical protein MUC49_00135 [Raineya sp.]|nr:hypothetical protein [Raineya sp.]
MNLFGNNNKEKFIKQLENFKENIKTEDPSLWIASLNSYLKKIFPLSFEDKIKNINRISFSSWGFSNEERGQKTSYFYDDPQGRIKAQNHIDSFIQEINDHGLEKSSNNNKPSWKTILTLPILAGMFWSGYYVGTTKLEKDKIELYDQKKKLEEDILKKDKQIDEFKKEIEIYKKLFNKK